MTMMWPYPGVSLLDRPPPPPPPLPCPHHARVHLRQRLKSRLHRHPVCAVLRMPPSHPYALSARRPQPLPGPATQASEPYLPASCGASRHPLSLMPNSLEVLFKVPHPVPRLLSSGVALITLHHLFMSPNITLFGRRSSPMRIIAPHRGFSIALKP